MKVFYSWQSDLDPKTTRNFIRRALGDAVKQIAKELEIEDAERPEVDEATKGSVGMVDITHEILDKISACSVYVADLTPISRARTARHLPKSTYKHLPNPNVMYEIGWASQTPGYDLIIGVMNSHKNPGPNCLPFDLRNRRVIAYHLAPDTPDEDRKKVRLQLTRELKDAIGTNLKKVAAKIAQSRPIPMHAEAFDDISIWDGPNKAITIGGSNVSSQTIDLQIEEGTRSFVRAVPSGYAQGIPNGMRLAEHQQLLHPPIGAGQGGDYGPCELGYCCYWFKSTGPIRSSGIMSMYLDDTGEIWTLDNHPAWEGKGNLYFSPPRMARNWLATLNQSMKLLDALGANKRRILKVGASELKGRRFYLDSFKYATGLKNSFTHQEERLEWSDDELKAYVLTGFNKALDAFGLEASSMEDMQAAINRS